MKDQIQGSDKKWQVQHPNYASMDSSPQTFFYTLSNCLKLQQSKNILQVGCGAGKLLSTILDLKSPQTSYLATDISQNMVSESKKRLQAHFTKYQSKLTFQQFLTKMKLSFDVQNGENIVLKQGQEKFDRIIANMVLCHANDPEKMLRNWATVATEDCLIGVSLMGDPAKNLFISGMRKSIEEVGEKLPETRPPYYWYDKISKIVSESGWQILTEFDQNSLWPILTYSPQNENAHIKNMIQKKLPEAARDNFRKKLMKLVNQDKVGIQVWSKVIIARRRKEEGK